MYIFSYKLWIQDKFIFKKYLLPIPKNIGITLSFYYVLLM